MDRIKVTFYLPLRDNAGQSLLPAINEVEKRCFAAFGGWTFVGHFKGAWQMTTGACQLDASAVYCVVLEEGLLPELEAILHDFKARAGQEAIYLEIDRDVEVRLL